MHQLTQLITDNRDILGLLSILGVTVIASILIHWVVICPCLYRRGSRFPTGLLFWRVFAELRRYKEIKAAAAQPVTPYYISFILAWFNLLLALGTAIRLLWAQSHWLGY
ncbi:MAG TPA: hypothetical protein VMV72_14150 [Verrucomicrobiae bacterium]|nr:hypothetical protein [Verrucomicrobiae bacterium]